MSFSSKGNFGDDGDAEYQEPSMPLVLMSAADGEAPDPDEQYSNYFTLADLTVTSLPYPNLPLDATAQDNLRRLAELLDLITDNVGSFIIASCYRSPMNQAALKSGAGGVTAASMAASTGYHPLGLAADITPTNGMTASQFAAALYNDPEINNLIGQITDKSEGGNETSLHISLQTPKFPKATLMYVGDDKQYYRMSASQITNFLSEKATEIETALEENPGFATGASLGLLAAIAVGTYLAYKYSGRF